jgi:Na+-translocating ferredoxin:NAD+ oxidoreductase RnfD subunit
MDLPAPLADPPALPPGAPAPAPEVGAEAGSAPLPRRTRWRAGSLIHSGVSVRGFYVMHALGASVPLVAGVSLYGWRAAAAVVTVVGAAALALLAWRNVGGRGRQIQSAQALWAALLLGLMLPAHLASTAPLEYADQAVAPAVAGPPWPALAAGGFAVVVLLWLVGGVGTGRFHAALYTYLLLAACCWPLLQPRWVLARQHLGRGDLLKAGPPPERLTPDPWLDRLPEVGQDGFYVRPAADALTQYTRGTLPLGRGRLPLHELIRERMPPLEDLVVGGHPAGVGSASAVAVIVGGLFLLYRGLIDFRIPLLVVAAAYVGFLTLPVPTVITDKGAFFQWLIARQPDVLWEQAVTFANYEMAAGPTLFMAFFLAPAPTLRPLARRARALYAVLLGLLTATAQLYLSVSIGPYLALAAVGLIAPILDRWFPPRTLV